MSQSDQPSKPGFGIYLRPWQNVFLTAVYPRLMLEHLLMSVEPNESVLFRMPISKITGFRTQPRQPPKAGGAFGRTGMGSLWRSLKICYLQPHLLASCLEACCNSMGFRSSLPSKKCLFLPSFWDLRCYLVHLYQKYCAPIPFSFLLPFKTNSPHISMTRLVLNTSMPCAIHTIPHFAVCAGQISRFGINLDYTLATSSINEYDRL